MNEFRPLVLGIDAGGTMTDTLLVDEHGHFAVGKASTTPHDESIGFLESAADAAEQWSLASRETFEQLAVVLYSGTGMLNSLLSRTGRRVGLLVTRGMEDAVLMGRGLQAWAGYSYPDRLHAVTHEHPEPLVPRNLVHGVTERIDQFGNEVAPVYEHEVVSAVEDLLEQGVEAICVCCVFSYVDDAHERKIAEIARTALAEHGAELPIYLSSAVRPVVREQSRLNSVVIEAYAADRSREQLIGVEKACQDQGFRYGVQTVLSYGGLAGVRYPRLHETMISGPVGGILGAKYVGDIIGADSVVVSDMGGTSFDISAITRGNVPIDNEPTLARFKLNLPTIAMDTIGAGAGTIIKVDPLTKKVSLGPESAGSTPGPVAFDMGGTEPTVCDCDVVMGRLNPDYFLGGKVKLNVEKAKQVLKEKVADPLGIDLYEAAEGMANLLEMDAREAIRQMVSARAVDPTEYSLMAYGGSGPLHMAEYSRGLGFKSILTFPFAAAFSAFGCTTADYLRRYSRSVQLALPPDGDEQHRGGVAAEINAVWQALQDAARREMAEEGHDPADVELQMFAMMRYTGQLEDVEVPLKLQEIGSDGDLDAMVAEFERLYTAINRPVAQYSEAGHSITELGLLAKVDKIKPQLTRKPLEGKTPPSEASKGTRSMYYGRQWHDAALWEMDLLRPGNEIAGPAVIEHPATTLVIPAGDRVRVDEWTILHYEHA
ncbi:hydantoinase/oxoprolinase family protein [Saccharopolyspora sp. WRP15-2]|uniref:Hydantoinase/oxoprolinase family protein n=1 Tax=Saccharopolyspora oryzae TaxID=2997343 RepID=A0ABT4UU18_9PSEU|nr:hydantoinase/oxoprolinase family protein [Saccharopolyspora oryzae]MDA3625193.1 hydantoinase/oxoprolinase family protein [Saccharopolyspora oryzae]